MRNRPSIYAVTGKKIVSSLVFSVLLLSCIASTSNWCVIAATTSLTRVKSKQVASRMDTHDILVVGATDGKVYALDAWNGDILWMFDSGGSMLDISDCRSSESMQSKSSPSSSSSSMEESKYDIKRKETKNSPVTQTSTSSDVMTQSSDFKIPQLIPSLDGRLYHWGSMNNEFKELDMTVIDLVKGNGPVRLKDENMSDVLFFGEKQTRLFTLDPTEGLMQPYLMSTRKNGQEILFGRSEYKTKVVNAQNTSQSRCITISEYFLQFSAASRCVIEKSDSSNLSPEIYVMQGEEFDDITSRIAAYNPINGHKLWEYPTMVDISALYGISSYRGVVFYEWSINGPSSLAKKKQGTDQDRITGHVHQRRSVTVSIGAIDGSVEQVETTGSDINQESTNQLHIPENKRYVTRLIRGEPEINENVRIRLRVIDGNYFLEHGTARLTGTQTEHTSSGSYGSGSNPRTGYTRRFWKSMENEGKRGVFITYYHVGAMLSGIVFSCILIAWGCYVKGLSASLASTANALKKIDSNNFFVSHVHQLTIERPGKEKITISSVISRTLVEESRLMALNNEEGQEAMVKFTRMAADEAAAVIAGECPNKSILRLEYFPNQGTVEDESTALVPLNSYSSTFESQCVDGIEAFVKGDEVPRLKQLMAPVEVLDTGEFSYEASIELLTSSTEDDIELEDKSSSSSTKSCRSHTNNTIQSEKEGISSNSAWSIDNMDDEAVDDEGLTEGKKNVHKKSTESGTWINDKSEAEVLFPFVCQSRFSNEFKEISAIGKGGFGQVMLAENRLDGRKYAIKRVGLNLKGQTSKTLQKFLREVKILALLDHPNIVRYYQAWLEKVDLAIDLPALTYKHQHNLREVSGAHDKPGFSTNNTLLDPINEMEYSEDTAQRNRFEFYIDDTNDGFEWEKNSVEVNEENVWREEDLTSDHSITNTFHHQQHKRRSYLSRSEQSRRRSTRFEYVQDSDSFGSHLECCDHWLYIQMQYCAGRNLGDYLALPTRPMEIHRILKIFVQIASALAHVHSCGLIHRDLKPANIFVADTDGESIKLGDFGLSRYAANVNMNVNLGSVANSDVNTVTVSDTTYVTSFELQHQVTKHGNHQISEVDTSSLEEHISTQRALFAASWSRPSISSSGINESTDNTAGVGTYLYASPEQVAGKKYNAKTDMYSLGMILFELCHEPFGTTMERYHSLRHARESRFPTNFGANILENHPEILEMMRLLLSSDPAARPSSEEVVKWSQQLYESSTFYYNQQKQFLEQHVSHPLRSPMDKGATGSTGSNSKSPLFMNANVSSLLLPPLDIASQSLHPPRSNGESLESIDEKSFVLRVEAKKETEKRIPNHNLLKEICDVISDVCRGEIEIKRCGLHVQDGGVQVLEFVLEGEREHQEKLLPAIEALDGVALIRV